MLLCEMNFPSNPCSFGTRLASEEPSKSECPRRRNRVPLGVFAGLSVDIGYGVLNVHDLLGVLIHNLNVKLFLECHH